MNVANICICNYLCDLFAILKIFVAMLLMLVGFTFYIVKRMDGSVKIKPYIFRLPWRLIYHENCGSFKSVRRPI